MFPRLLERRNNFGDHLSGGEPQMLAVGRALVLHPRLLPLDKPLESLAPIIFQEILAMIRSMIAVGGMAEFLVEQHAQQILPPTQSAIVLERGRIVLQGASAGLQADPARLGRWLGAVGAGHQALVRGGALADRLRQQLYVTTK